MMYQPRKFDRITFDIHQLGGQAHIRDLSITVWEITALSRQGKTIDQIIEIYPDLTSEDIHQALGYSCETLLREIRRSFLDARSGFTNMAGYNSLVTDIKSEHLSLQASEFLQTARQFGDRAGAIMRHLFFMAQFYDELNERVEPQRIAPGELVQQILADLPHEFLQHRTIELIAHVTDGIPDFAGFYRLPLAVVKIITDDFLFLKPVANLILVQENANFVTIRVHKTYESESSPNARKIVSYPYDEGGSIALAMRILWQNNTPLQITESPEGITFEFTLPVWED